METKELFDKIISFLKTFDVKGLEALDISKKSKDIDYLIMCTALSEDDAKVVASTLEQKLKSEGVQLRGRDGYTKGTWIVLDYDRVVVHIFTEMAREKYSLEKLWKDGKNKLNF